MTVMPAEYATFLASLGNPQHHVMVGPDWWACLCGAVMPDVGPTTNPHRAEPYAHQHAEFVAADTVRIPWQWLHVEADHQTAADLHFSLWENEDIDPRRVA